jgi:hypothetical protein
MSTSSDCLVLLVESIDTEINEVLGKVYVLYDSTKQEYLVRGHDFEGDTKKRPFSFVTYGSDYESVIDFIDFLSSDDNVRITLYNFDDLPLTSQEITYEYLEDYSSEEYEILAFRPQQFSRKCIGKMLKMIKNIFNYY